MRIALRKLIGVKFVLLYSGFTQKLSSLKISVIKLKNK